MSRSNWKAPRISPSYGNRKSGINKTAWMGGGGGGLGGSLAPSSVSYSQPKFYSPLHTPSNWQIPVKRPEVYSWSIDSKGLMQLEDFTFVEISDYIYNKNHEYARASCLSSEAVNELELNLKSDFRPASVVQDPVTGGIIYTNVKSPHIQTGNGNTKQPIHISQRECVDKKFIKIKCSGNYRTINLSEEHNVFLLKGSEVKRLSRLHKSKIASNKRLKNPTDILSMEEFYSDTKWSVERSRADQVRIGDFLLTPVPQISTSNKYEHLDNDFMWLVGHSLADGSLVSPVKGSSYVDFNCSVEESEVVDYLKTNLQKRYGRFKSRVHTNSDKCERVSIYSNLAYTELANFVCGKLSKKKLTKEIRHLGREQILTLLGGYFDGDGFYVKKDKSLAATSTSVDLIDQIHNLLLQCGVKSTIKKEVFSVKTSTYIKNNKVKRTRYSVIIAGGEVHKIAPYLKSSKIPQWVINYKFKAHNNRFFFQEDGTTYYAQPVESVEEYLYTGEGFDLQINPERSYVVGGFKVSNCRFFANNEPKIAAALDWYSQFPVQDYENVIDDIPIRVYYDDVKRRLDIVNLLRQVSYEYFALGDVFIFADIACPQCNGSGMVPGTFDPKSKSYEPCSHKGGTFSGISILNPDWMQVVSGGVFGQNQEVVYLMPDQNLKNIVQSREPYEIYSRIPDFLKMPILQGKPILLHPMCISHLAYNRIGYQPFGRSIIMRLFRTLAYKDKLTQAQWIVADRHIVPVRIVKVGNAEIPATESDIAQIQQQLLATSSDPNLTLVTHHAFEYDWIGACYSSDTEVLTEEGWKFYDDVRACDKIATLNPETNNLEYHNYINRFLYDYDSEKDGEMIHFTGKRIDSLVTPNHKMYVKLNNRKKYDLIEARDISRGKFLTNVSYQEGSGSVEVPDVFKNLTQEEYLKFIGYFISEGGYMEGRSHNVRTGPYTQYGIYISQNSNSPHIDEISELLYKISDNIRHVYDTRNENVNEQIFINSKEIADFCVKEFGYKSKNKKLPLWCLSLSEEKSNILLQALMNGDGASRFYEDKKRNVYTTTSKLLAGQIQELVLKLGYSAAVSTIAPKKPQHNVCYRINWSENKKSKEKSIRPHNVKRVPYSGKVWCFEVPNHIFITRRNGKIGIHGNSGKVLQLSKEYDMINQELLDGLMINQALLNGDGPNYCHSEDTEFLTLDGWKLYKDVRSDDDLATFNRENGKLEYQRYLNRWEFDYNSETKGKMIHFTGSKLDCLVTPNHNMLVLPRQDCKPDQLKNIWELVQAKDVKPHTQLRGCIESWEGSIADVEIPDGMTLEDYVDMSCFYLTEGWLGRGSRLKSYKRAAHGITFSQSVKNKEVYSKMPSLAAAYNGGYDEEGSTSGKELQTLVEINFGEYSDGKRLPKWMKNLPKEYLLRILNNLTSCDGNTREATKKNYYSYFTTSKQLADDVQEIALKCGFSPKVVFSKATGYISKKDKYTVYWTDAKCGRYPTTEPTKGAPNKVQHVDYNGKVACFEVPNHTLITRRNGKVIVTGNSNASIGIEALIQRLESFREVLARWIEERIYRPIAIMQGFTTKDEMNNVVPLYPKVKFKELNLRDDTQKKNIMMQLAESGYISRQTLLNYLGLDYNVEVDRLRMEQIVQMEYGLSGGGDDGEMGGALGGGGMPGGMPGGGMGASMSDDGMGGSLNMPSDGMEMSRPAGNGFRPRVSKNRPEVKGPSKEEVEAAQPQKILMNHPESKLFQKLREGQERQDIKYPFIPQYRPDNVHKYKVDFAFPHIKLAIEVDGEIFHNNPKQKKIDQERDNYLGRKGWWIYRFPEKDIKEDLPLVYETIKELITRKEQAIKSAEAEGDIISLS